ncbi:phosphocarrier protein [Croceifilum oryzae]|uniref:Phosphocarrier protein HPr n=1 Tax=Croceifilum oryzae TaxID=1553429 RepID=A0AAJ1WSK5_9BACL|nr:HPr family phosphocarrier protein [Croceifilum oryzae]MDQ0416051.1 phosphocarrier protein [Croceifilum oryzae]
MTEKTVVIQNSTGLHARPAALLIQKAGSFKSSIKIVKDGREADAKSLLGVMSLAIKGNESITIRAEGEDEAAAIEAMTQFLESHQE